MFTQFVSLFSLARSIAVVVKPCIRKIDPSIAPVLHPSMSRKIKAQESLRDGSPPTCIPLVFEHFFGHWGQDANKLRTQAPLLYNLTMSACEPLNPNKFRKD